MQHAEASHLPTSEASKPEPTVDDLDVLQRAARRVAGETDAEKIVAHLVDEARQLCRAEVGGFAPREAVGSSRVVRVGDLASDVRYARHPPVIGKEGQHEANLASYLLAPICAPRTGEIFGGIALGHSQTNFFTEEHQRSLTAIALMAALSLEHARVLERSKRVEREHARRARQATLAADVAGAMARSNGSRPILQRCAEAVVRNLDAAFARIWILDAEGTTLELQASAGMYTHLDGAHARVPVGDLKIGRIAAEGAPHLTNNVAVDPWIGDRDWARREGLTSFAGYPLALRGRVVGVLALFGRRELMPDTLDALAAIADTIAVGIDRARAERALLDERARFFGLLMEAPAAIAFLEGHQQRYAFVNRQYQTLVQRPLLGRTVQEVFGADDPIVDDLRRVLTTGESMIGREVPTSVSTDGRERVGLFDFVYEPTRDAHGVVDGVLIHAIEVTQQVEARRQVEQTNEILEAGIQERTAALVETNRELEAFSYTVSHDLRAPIRHIAGFLDLLRLHSGDALDAKATRYVDTIGGAAKQMGLLIDGLLAFSRTGRIAITKREFDGGTLVREVVAELQPELQGRNVDIRVEALPTLFGDPTMLRAVVANLLANAVKYSSKTERAVIEVGRLEDSDDGQVILFVRDNGVGFDMAHVGKLFGVFQRLHGPEEFEGTGIGLATVRRIVLRHGGRVWAESAPDRGATFYVSLPQKKAEEIP